MDTLSHGKVFVLWGGVESPITQERKRQYAALRRAVYREAPPALVAKFSLASDGERFLDFNMEKLNKA